MFLWEQGSRIFENVKVPWKNLCWKLFFMLIIYSMVTQIYLEEIVGYFPLMWSGPYLLTSSISYSSSSLLSMIHSYWPLFLRQACSLVPRFSYMIFSLPRGAFLIHLHSQCWTLYLNKSYPFLGLSLKVASLESSSQTQPMCLS